MIFNDLEIVLAEVVRHWTGFARSLCWFIFGIVFEWFRIETTDILEKIRIFIFTMRMVSFSSSLFLRQCCCSLHSLQTPTSHNHLSRKIHTASKHWWQWLPIDAHCCVQKQQTPRLRLLLSKKHLKISPFIRYLEPLQTRRNWLRRHDERYPSFSVVDCIIEFRWMLGNNC